MALLNSSGQVVDTQIILQTRLGVQIENIQSWNLTALDWNPVSNDSIRKYVHARQLSEACPVYNCHGLTFGSRRTAVTHEVSPILAQDGYSEVPEAAAREGDIAAYIEENEISHTGFVIGREALLIGSSTTLRIWSKWSRGPEMSHLVQDCPYYAGEGSVRFFRLTEWRDAWRER
jgi:hypothetical protein